LGSTQDSPMVLCFCFDLLRLVYPMLLVSLDCPFLIAPSVFFNVYLYLHHLFELSHRLVKTCFNRIFPISSLSFYLQCFVISALNNNPASGSVGRDFYFFIFLKPTSMLLPLKSHKLVSFFLTTAY
jgi:hypothetical protein